MAKDIHKGTELNNVKETWSQNEQNNERGMDADRSGTSSNGLPEESDLSQIIKEEAAEYDNVNKEDRLLSGDRATLNDDDDNGSDE